MIMILKIFGMKNVLIEPMFKMSSQKQSFLCAMFANFHICCVAILDNINKTNCHGNDNYHPNYKKFYARF